ncbi:MAG: hypothetical protein IT164_11175 [Bryobacterales bacterium]|nr:hypothetical protein [Bryobacterales bacterium]
MTSLLWQFSYLQVLDYLTTIAFLLTGVQEGNPFVRWSMQLAPSPFLGLAFVKLAALMLGFYCLRMGKERLLSRINVMFALLVAWNLVALILGSAHLPS